MMTSLDLFAGAGGMTLGFKNAGIKSIGAIELDRFAAETFSRNFPEIPMFNRDIYSFSRERRKQNHEEPFDIDADLIIDLFERVERHLNAIWWKPEEAVLLGKIINRPR